MRLGRWSSSDSASVSATNLGSTMLNSSTGRTGSKFGWALRYSGREMFQARQGFDMSDRSSSLNDSRVVRTVTRHGRIRRPLPGSVVSTTPLKTTVSMCPP